MIGYRPSSDDDWYEREKGRTATMPERSHLWPDEAYQDLDPGIRFAVRVLHARGIETGQSCEGGEGHSYDRPTVDLLDNGRAEGFAALAALENYGLRVRDVSLHWSVDKGLPTENFWRITFWQAWPERADEVPMFAWHYRVQELA